MPSEQSELARLEQANALGLTYLKTIVLLNGGAILALLTFIGNATESPVIVFELSCIRLSMWAFLFGISSILLALVVSYSYTATAPEHDYHQFWDRHVIKLNLICGLLSLIAFIVGVSSLILGANAPA